MSSLEKIRKNILESRRIKIIVFILGLPFSLTILNLLLGTLFQLGIYTGTFLRFLYSIVVY